MKFFTTALLLSVFATETLAFPAEVLEAVARDPIKYEQLARDLASGKNVRRTIPGFNPSLQYISTSGIHKWVAPKKTDQRGPCPGLNAMANHGYLPHNGIATIAQFIEATTTVVGMGADIAAFLATYGAVFNGDLTQWSIGGPSTLVGIPGFGYPLGLSGSHNNHEGDVSPTRGDLYQYKQDYKLIMPEFTALYAAQASETEETSNYNISLLTQHRVNRLQQSVSKNPYYFNGFFTGLFIQPATYTFIYRFFANHSAEYPEGRLSQSVLKSWFGVKGTYPKFTYNPGYERIPNNWYRRAIGDEYDIPFFFSDIIAMASAHPQFLAIGGNTGKRNSFTGVNVGNLTDSLYNDASLMNPDTLACFIYELLFSQAPNFLAPYFDNTAAAVAVLAGGASHILPVNYTCPSLQNISHSQFQQAMSIYPGYTKLGLNGTY